MNKYKIQYDKTMLYDYLGSYAKNLVPYYLPDISRYATLPEQVITPRTNPDPEGNDPTKHYKLAMQRKGYPVNDKPLSPVDPIGEFAVTGAALKLPTEAVIGAAKFLPKFINTLKINKVFSNNINKFDGTVGKEYFKAPDKWYRMTETPEVPGIREVGKNVTTHDAADMLVPSNSWRLSIIDNGIKPEVDNGWKVKEPEHGFNISLTKNGSAHGNTSLAAKGLLWLGTTSRSHRFPKVVLEGLAPNQIYAAYDPITKLTLSRSNFKLQNWEGIPYGERLGFHTGEMPLENLTAFLKLKNGRYSFEPVLPDKRIYVEPVLLNVTGTLKELEKPLITPMIKYTTLNKKYQLGGNVIRPDFFNVKKYKDGKDLLFKTTGLPWQQKLKPGFYNNARVKQLNNYFDTAQKYMSKEELIAQLPHSERPYYRDEYGVHLTGRIIPVSNTDPIGEFIVTNAILNKPLQGVASIIKKVAANSAISKAILKNIGNYKSDITPLIRTKIGDVEVDNPLLYYRLGSLEMGDAFNRLGIVESEESGYVNPMFAKGQLWYGIPKKETLEPIPVKANKWGLDLSKGKEDSPKTDLLVSSPSTKMTGANNHSGKIDISARIARLGPIMKSPINIDMYGEDFIELYNKAYLNSKLLRGLVTRISNHGGVRRVPEFTGAANKSNTTLYKFDPEYGYRKYDNTPIYKYLKLVDKKLSGGALDFNSWYKTVPTDRNDTLNYNLRRAYELAPKLELELWRTSSLLDLKNGKNHLRSVYLNPNTGIYEFMKSKHHPTIQKELDWYNSNDKEAVDFRKSYSLDTSGDYYKYVPKKFYFGGLIKKKYLKGGTLSKNILNLAKYLMNMPKALGPSGDLDLDSEDTRFTPHVTLQDDLNKNNYDGDLKNYSYSLPKDVVITGTFPMYLETQEPFTAGYPIGHSSVEVATFNNNGGGNVYEESKRMSDKGYNLLTNNCSDGTRQVLEYTFNKKINPFLFTTPGDVRDFAIDSLLARPSSIYPNNLVIPLNIKLKRRAIRQITKLNNVELKYEDGGILTYDNSQYRPSLNIVSQINKWEGSSMNTNNPISTEFNNFINLLPKDSVNKLSPNLLDALFSYNYNRPKAFRTRALPYIQLLSTAQDQNTYNNIINLIANSFAVKSKLRGLIKRSNTEKQIFSTP